MVLQHLPAICWPFFVILFAIPTPYLGSSFTKKALNFYLGPGTGVVDHLHQWKGIFLITSLGDWSFLLPLGVLLVVIFLINHQNRQTTYIALFTAIILVVNTFIPFFPRYLMPAVPLFIILVAVSFKKYLYLILLVALLNIPLLIKSLDSSDVRGHTDAVARFISTTAYHELYRSFLPSSSLPSETDFITTAENLFETLSVRTISVKVDHLSQNGNKASADYTLSYITKYGPVDVTKQYNFVRYHNQWKLVWDSNYLYPNQIATNTGSIALKNLLNSRAQIIATRSPWKSVYAIPQAMYHWTQDVDKLAQLTGQSPREVDTIIKKFVPDNYPRFVGYVSPAVGLPQAEEMIKTMGGVSLRDSEYLRITAANYPNLAYLAAYIHGLYFSEPQLFFPAQDTEISLTVPEPLP